MIFISIFKLIVAKAIPSLNLNLSSVYFTRISAIIFLYAGILSFNILYIQSIGSGIGIYSGLFHVTQVQSDEPVLFMFIILSLLVLSIILLLLLLSLMNKFHTYKTESQTLNLVRKNKKLFWSLLFLMFLLFSVLTSLQGLDMSFNSIDKPISWLLQYIPDGKSNNSVPMDPVKMWPSGVPQSSTIIGTMIGTFAALTRLGVNPRLRVLGALSAGGISSSTILYNSILENSIGFNRFMYGLTVYRQTKIWPSIEQISNYNEETVTKNAQQALSQADQSKVNSVVEEVKNLITKDGGSCSGASNFVPTSQNNNLDLINNLIDTIFNNFNNLFQPSPVTGYLDDLIGQQIAIYFIILFISVNLILLMIVYIVNNLLLFNKEFILKQFSGNRFVQFYFKYQILSIKFSLFIFPLFIFLGLFTLVHSSYYMLTHPIPYEQLGVDLHIFVNNK